MVVYKCARCNYTTEYNNKFINHLERKNTCDKNMQNIKWNCNKCNSNFIRKYLLLNHLKKRECKTYKSDDKQEQQEEQNPDIKKLEIMLEIEREKSKQTELTFKIQEMNYSKNSDDFMKNDRKYNIFNDSSKIIPLDDVDFEEIGITVDDIYDLKDGNIDKIYDKINKFIKEKCMLFYVCRDKYRYSSSYVTIDYELINDNNNDVLRHKIINEIGSNLCRIFKDKTKTNPENIMNQIFVKRLKDKYSYIYRKLIECFAKSLYMDSKNYSNCKSDLKLYKHRILNKN